MTIGKNIQRSVVLILFMSPFMLKSQSFRIEDFKKNFSKKEWLKVNGGVSLQGTYYHSSPSYGHDKWNYYLNGNVNFNLFNLIQIPLSINLTNSGIKYSYPHLPNRFSLHPSYKWATAHIGDVSMSYSPYTLGGHQFTGGGVDLTPGKWYISAMFGRMQKSVEYDSTNTTTSVPAAYKRYGVGGKVKYQGDVFFLGTSVFYAKDNVRSLKKSPSFLGIKPQENVATNIEAGVTLFKNLRISGMYAFSFLDENIEIETEKYNFYQAINADISYEIKSHTIGLGYERIDPEYKSLGAYYFNNDIESLTANYSASLLNSKLSWNARVGVQRNDLKKQSADKEFSFAGSLNFNVQPIENWQLSLGYSNMQSYQRVKSQFDYINEFDISENVDTLSYTQVSHQADFNTSYSYKQGETKNHNWSLSCTYQQMNSNDNTVEQQGLNTSYITNGSVSYGVQFIPKSLSLNFLANVSYTDIQSSKNLILGPTVSLSSQFLDKTMNLSVSLSSNVSFLQKIYTQLINNARLSLSYTLKKKHCFALATVAQYKVYKKRSNDFLYNASLTYSFTF